MAKTYLNRESILRSDDIKFEEVDVPEWGGTVVVKALSGSERDKFEGSVVDIQNGGARYKFADVRAKLCVLSIVDPETKAPLFTVADIEVLGAKSAAALDRVFDVAQRLSKISEKDMESMIKN